MNLKLILTAIFFSLFLCFSCKNDPKNDAIESKSLVFETKSFERKGGECKEDHLKCISIKLKYPFVKEGKENVQKAINEFIKSMLLESIVPDSDKNISDFDAAADQLIKYYQDQLKEFPDYEMSWEVEVDGTAEVVNNFAVITLPTYSNLGGAHPNHHITIANFDLSTGNELKLRELIKDTKAFQALAQKRFIEARISEYDLGEVNIDDFFFGEGFQMPENFAVKNEGLFFYYNPYEAAPYTLGTTEFIISYKDLKGIIKM